MNAVAPTGLGPALAAVRGRPALIGVLLALAALGWWSTADRMQGMDRGPGTPLGALGWFLGVWVVMMAAMMLPSAAPAIALYARTIRTGAPWTPLAFTAGYLLAWTAAGAAAYGIFVLGREAAGDELAWSGAGRWLPAGTLLAAAVYELTALKHACLSHCPSPHGHRGGGMTSALVNGLRHGAWCIGCCWALMASLFALGVMSVAAMAFVAALIALEKTVPWGRAATWTTAAFLLLVGVLLIAAPDAIPGLTIPSDMDMDMA
jgi:predicted metal-binding membrane protein